MKPPLHLLLSPRAAGDLDKIADYIARDNPPRAVSFLSELEDKCRRHRDNPRTFPRSV